MIIDRIQKRRLVLAAILIILISGGLGLAKPGAKLLEAVAGISLPCQVLGCEAPASETTSKEARLETIQTADEALRDLADRHAQNILKDTPEWASQMGVTEAFAGEGFRSRLSQYDQTSTLKAYTMQETMLRELQDLNRQALSERSKITYDVMLNAYTIAGQQNAFEVGIPSVLSANAPYSVDQLFGPHIGLPRLLIAQSRIRTTEDAENWLSRLSEVDRVLMETADAVERDAKRGVIPPYFALEAVAASARDFTSSEIVEHPIKTSLTNKLDATDRMTEAEKTAVYERASRIVAEESYPAYRSLSDRLEAQIPAAGRDAGIWRLPEGEAMYRVALDAWGGNGMSPDEIHQIGLDDVARIHTQMDGILRYVGYIEGPIGLRMATLFKDPIYLVPNTDTAKAELVKELQRDANSVLDIADDWFLTIPDYPIEVRRIPPLEQDSASGGYYTPPPIDRSRPGIFWVNMKDSADNPVIALKSLVFHEAVPGHHFQATMALSGKDLPLIQNMMWFGDYGEGWALYAEELAKEMGLYEGDPLGDLGRLRMELYRAARLVVDTGLHHKRWSRDDAIDYMVEVTGESRESITREIERYAVWPGQAASYKLGMIQFQRLRAKAETELGEAFDIREFHDVVLRDGSMPMAVLAGRVDAWIKSKKKA